MLKRRMAGVVTAVLAMLVTLLYCAPLQAKFMLAPNGEGYWVADSNESSGPRYSFVDISETGTPLALLDDSSVEKRIGFEFGYFGKKFYTVNISSNGYLTFVDSLNTTNSAVLPIPQPAAATDWQPGPLIAPWFDDLDPEAGGDVFFEVLDGSSMEGGRKRLVVQWRVPHHLDTPGPDGSKPLIEFQVILEQSTDRILFQYRTTTTNAIGLRNGRSATSGLQGCLIDDSLVCNGVVGIGYSAGEAVLTDELAVGFTPIKYLYGYVGVDEQQSVGQTEDWVQSGVYDQVLNYQVEVVNGKSVATNFTVELLPGTRWQVEAPTSTGLLAPGEKTTLSINVTIPSSGVASMADEVVAFRVTDYVEEVTSGGDSTGSSTSTSNNEAVDTPARKVRNEVASYIVLRPRCFEAGLSLPCFQEDADGDGVIDELEPESRTDPSKISGFTTRSEGGVDIALEQGVFHGFSLDEALTGPKRLAFPDGVFNFRIRPDMVGGNVALRITPSSPWPKEMELFSVNEQRQFFKLDVKSWKRIEDSNTVEILLGDGGLFDEDIASNGVIIARFAMGVIPPADEGGAGFAGALYGELLLLLAALVALRHVRAGARKERR